MPCMQYKVRYGLMLFFTLGSPKVKVFETNLCRHVALRMDTCGDTLSPRTVGPGGCNTAVQRHLLYIGCCLCQGFIR